MRRYPQFHKDPARLVALPSMGTVPQTVVRRRYAQFQQAVRLTTLPSLGTPSSAGKRFFLIPS